MISRFFEQGLIISLIVILRYLLIGGIAFLLFYVVFKRQKVIKKIQEKFPTGNDYKRDISYSILSSIIFGLFFTALIIFEPFTRIYKNIETYGVAYYILSYPLMILIHDTYFYWTHRLIHHPRLFRQVHLVHHKATNPSPWTAHAFHPLEAIVQAFVIPLIAFVMPVHKFALIFYFIFQLMHNVYGHLGYELVPGIIRNSKLGKYLNTSNHHNAHHKYFTGNYGLFFTFWDRWMGTLRKD